MKEIHQAEIAFWKGMHDGAPDDNYKREYKACWLGARFKKLSNSQQVDFAYLSAQAAKERCCTQNTSEKLVYIARSVEEFYWLWDTHGLNVRCLDQHKAELLKQAKAFLNLTVEMWCQDVIGCLLSPEEVWTMCLDSGLPWLWKAFQNQCKREAIKTLGFVPVYISSWIDHEFPQSSI